MKRAIGSILLMGVLAIGCDRPAEPVAQGNGDPPATQPTTAPAQQQPRPPSFIAIDGQPHEFPAARLTLQVRDGRVFALLFSDDPPEALHRDYLGNSYYLPMTLEIDSPAQLVDAMWVARRSETDEIDKAEGVFLRGDRYQLSPLDVEVAFEPLDARETVVLVRGLFRQTDTRNPHAPAQILPLTARLAAEVKVR
jgi:hypothetical protein